MYNIYVRVLMPDENVSWLYLFARFLVTDINISLSNNELFNILFINFSFWLKYLELFEKNKTVRDTGALVQNCQPAKNNSQNSIFDHFFGHVSATTGPIFCSSTNMTSFFYYFLGVNRIRFRFTPVLMTMGSQTNLFCRFAIVSARESRRFEMFRS